MDPAVYSRIKTPDAGVPLLQTESEVRAAHHLNNVMYMKEEKLSLQVWIAWLNQVLSPSRDANTIISLPPIDQL
jgi:hypothetical protein